MSLIKEMYLHKEIQYFSLEREIFKNSILQNGQVIFDIGCGTGALGSYFIQNQSCLVHGFEINSNVINEAKSNLTSIVEGNIETDLIPFKNDYFDYIILGDVIEHLINPILTINRLKPYLKKGGTILITTPNIKHWSVVYNLLFKDSWDYKSWGILDFTHLRFFTKKSFLNMLNYNNEENFEIKRVIQNPSKSHYFNLLTLNIFNGFLASHLFIKIKK